MKLFFRNFLADIYNSAAELNINNIISLISPHRAAKLIDLGCDDGEITMKIAKKLQSTDIFGIDIIEEELTKAKEKKIKTYKMDLNNKLEFNDESFDVINANQVIEHIADVDLFVSEIKRILKKGGYAIISTENASSWCNIFSSIMGWQIFSLTNFSKYRNGIGNPLSLNSDSKGYSSWNHVRIWNIRGLKEYFELLGFEVIKISGAGYFPLPAVFGKFDVTHSHFITYKIEKK
jgi:SAM-dependent methyltransferase